MTPSFSRPWPLLLLLAALALAPGCAFFQAHPGPTTDQMKAIEHWNNAMALRAAGEEDRVAEELSKAINADPNMYQAYYHLGLAYQVLGQPDKARQAWMQGITRARSGPERKDYPRSRALAEMQAALAGLEARRGPEERGLTELKPPAKPAPKPASKPAAPAMRAMINGNYAVLYSSNLKPVSARRDLKRLVAMGYKTEVRTRKEKGRTWHRVWVGCCTTRARAMRLRAELMKKAPRKGLAVMQPGR